jgi:hypothetical protein
MPKDRQVTILLSWGVESPKAAHHLKVGPILFFLATTDSFKNEPKCSSPVKAIQQ